MLVKILNQSRVETLALPPVERRKLWVVPFLKSYFVVFLGYLAMYLIRKNYNVSQNELIDQFQLSKTQLGQIGFWFSITYGIGKTAVGYFGNGRNTKNFVSLLLVLSSFAMMGFGAMTGSLGGMIFFFALNGLFQSAGGPMAYSTITNWTSQKNRGRFLGLWNISHNLGGALAAGVATYGAQKFFDGDVRGMFFFPAFIALIIGVLGLFMGSDSPEAYGLGPAEEIFEEPLSTVQMDFQKNNHSAWQTFEKYVLKNPFIWGLCFSNVFLYVIRIGVDQWSLVYAKEVLGFSKETATMGFTVFELGAFSGAFIWSFYLGLSI